MSREGSRVPVGLLGMLLIVGSVESYVGRHPLDYVETKALTWKFSDSAARKEAVGADVLFLGDSLVRHGLLPDVLDARLGVRSYNLSITASTAPATYLMLKRALDAGARPKVIVVDFLPDLLSGSLNDPWRHWSLILSLPEIVSLALDARDLSFLGATAINRLIPSHRSRWEIRTDILAAFRNETDPLPSRNRSQERAWIVSRGGQITPDNPQYTGGHEGFEPFYRNGAYFRCNRVNRKYVDKILSLAESKGICVYWLMAPVSPSMQAHRVRSGSEARSRQFALEMMGKHPGMVVLDGTTLEFDHTRFVDPVHLTGKGAVALTEALADAIVANRSGWVSLGSPDFEGGSRLTDKPKTQRARRE